MIRTAKCLPHCKLVIYSSCGHDIDTDLTEELTDEAECFGHNNSYNAEFRHIKRTARGNGHHEV
ncbi:MAG: hypothetical protein IKO11_03670 [Lachnospiraceae bacterium]|nr:hypothetical protein [Lachnospiraceae bacterium]